MIYYETIEPLTLYKAHEIEEVKTISENPCFALSAWMRVKTKEGRNFYLCEHQLEEMQDHPQYYPTEKKEET